MGNKFRLRDTRSGILVMRPAIKSFPVAIACSTSVRTVSSAIFRMVWSLRVESSNSCGRRPGQHVAPGVTQGSEPGLLGVWQDFAGTNEMSYTASDSVGTQDYLGSRSANGTVKTLRGEAQTLARCRSTGSSSSRSGLRRWPTGQTFAWRYWAVSFHRSLWVFCG